MRVRLGLDTHEANTEICARVLSSGSVAIGTPQVLVGDLNGCVGDSSVDVPKRSRVVPAAGSFCPLHARLHAKMKPMHMRVADV